MNNAFLSILDKFRPFFSSCKLHKEFMDIEPRIYLPIEGKSFYHESSEFLNGNL